MDNCISFLSWNLAMLGRPSQAPQHWELCDTEEIIREQIVELAPDIVLFQELPGPGSVYRNAQHGSLKPSKP